ncbi:ATP synthase subunit I [[Clostridium] polysaccharolyticum]|uniref:ATP synthase I chain n=1 Tax=[Clostridium] polysaccharolyticum TaxID=29364 RepID=A0A1I0BRD9_9FIRM|nr:ATP synthase subunit I [[Clostridium] polysaccharolyticum]SET09272.1 ATP synthase I chain [[Clostridium] polysaccharolyticum]
MEDSKQTLNRLLLGILFYAVPFIAVDLFWINKKFTFLFGLTIGCFLSAFIAIHLYKSLDYCLSLDPESAEKAMKKKTMIRFFVMLLAVGISFCFPEIINPLGLFIGMMGLKISVYFQPFIHKWCTSWGTLAIKFNKKGR